MATLRTGVEQRGGSYLPLQAGAPGATRPWSSIAHGAVPPPRLPVPDLLNPRDHDPHRPFLVDGTRTWTRSALAREVERRAVELSGSLTAGRIWPRTLLPDGDGIRDLLAAWSRGAVVAPLGPRLAPAERSRALDSLSDSGSAGLSPRSAAVLWTSGTTGEPRGVVLTWDALRASATGAQRRLGLSPGDVWYTSLSLAHVGGLALVTRALLLGSGLVAAGAFDLDALLAHLSRASPAGPVTHLSLVPTQLRRLLEAWGDRPPPPSLRCILVGGAATPEPLLLRAVDGGWPVALTYGMTEMTSQVATAPPDRVRQKQGSVGRPLPGVELRLTVDGEILVRGGTRAAGYVGSAEPLTDPEGWIHTGDLGHLDGDGDLWIVGRRSHRIISGGVTVDPHEIEEVLRSHPAVRDVCVVGLPDLEWGERVAALVVPEGPGIPDEALARWAADRLGPARRPRVWARADALPLNRNGKVDRRAAAARFPSS